MTLPSLAYAGIPYHVFGMRLGALFLTIAWIRSPMARSSGDIASSAARTALSPSSAALSSLARALIAAFSSAVNAFFFLGALMLLLSFVRRRVRSDRAAAATW